MKASLPLIAGIAAKVVLAQSPLTNDPKWLYDGCYVSPPGHVLDWFKVQNLTTAVTIESCLSSCPVRYAALGAGACYCADLVPATLSASPTDGNCTFPCNTKSDESCGGPIDDKTQQPSALSLYDSQPAAPITYPGWTYDGCAEHFSTIGNFTHAATMGSITVEGCLTSCDRAGLKYEFAALSGQSCYCATRSSAKVPETYADNSVCSATCLGNERESCGGSYTADDPPVAVYERPNGPGDPKVTDVFSGALITRTTSAVVADQTSGNGGIKTSGTKSATLATETGKSGTGRTTTGGLGVGIGAIIVGMVIL